MKSKRKWETSIRSRSIGNLALADNNRATSRHHKDIHLKLIPSSIAVLENGIGADPLSAAKGIILGVALSIVLWSSIILLIAKIL